MNNNAELRILILEDVPTDAELMERELRKNGFALSLRRVETREGFIQELEGFAPDLILADYKLPDFDGLSALEIAKEKFPDVPFIFVTGVMGEEWAVETIKKGATDYVLKDRIFRLTPAVKRAIEEARLRTEHKKAQDALKESEERYRSIFEKTPNAMVAFDAETLRFENVNRAATELYGYTEEEFLSLTPVDVSAEVEKTRDSIQNGLAEKSAHIPIRYHKKKDGTIFPIEIFMGTFLSCGCQKGFAVIVDLTDKKKAEEALRLSEERYRVVTESASDAIICINTADDIYLWNKKAEEMFGYAAEEAMGKLMHQLIVPEKYREKAYEGLKGFYQTGTGEVVGKIMELTALRKDGSEFPIELSVSAMKVNDDWHATGIVRDITERKKAEEKIKEQLDFLQRFEKVAVGREFRIKELRDENESLKARISETEKRQG